MNGRRWNDNWRHCITGQFCINHVSHTLHTTVFYEMQLLSNRKGEQARDICACGMYKAALSARPAACGKRRPTGKETVDSFSAFYARIREMGIYAKAEAGAGDL